MIVPARNEEDCIGRCLESLVAQQGISFQITVVDDGSTDRTRAIAESFPGCGCYAASEPAPGVMGKCNALITGAAGSTAKWLLFTDADTFHYPGSLAAAVKEAESRNVDLLSYSPEQETATWWELAVMPRGICRSCSDLSARKGQRSRRSHSGSQRSIHSGPPRGL